MSTPKALRPGLPALVRPLMHALPSPYPRRQRRLAGRHALVDGIPFRMPVNSNVSPVLMAAFPVDRRAAARLLPGGELHPLTLPGGHGLLVVTVIDYRSTDIGRYIEYSIALACTHGPRPAPPLLPGLLPRAFGTGQYVLDLPVSSEISVKGGKGIWGMPKHQANLDFTVTDSTVSSTYEVDGRAGTRIEVERPPATALPLRTGAVNYCAFRGMLMRSVVYFEGAADVAVGRGARARLVVGDAPRVAALHGLGIGEQPLFTCYLPSSRGVLDDHVACWFLTDPRPGRTWGEPLTSVVGLGLSRDWPAPPHLHTANTPDGPDGKV
ncbi:acetoacetate decarboxylase family protein [Streptomyces fragilis]|uniref:Acetoacetate decarboxylase family protein n=1 Tax=Streptomyces fragilis TaxID=67301 RepID=A0ABV2YJ63_9ACTN|nr:acetoacetate decarboxylase family protein [Streptomyces fragilis]